MVRFGVYGLAVLVSLVLVAPVGADTLQFTAGPASLATPSWQGPVVCSGGPPCTITNSTYWNNGSLDGANFNMGNYMVAGDGRDGFFTDFAASKVSWWSKGDGTADPNMSFCATCTGGAVGTTLRLEAAGLKDTNELGYYLLSTPSILVPLLTGGAGVGDVALFVPTGDFGLYLKNTSVGTLFRMDTTASAGGLDIGLQHFTAFRNLVDIGPRSVWVGVEDVVFGSPGCTPGGMSCADRDYQDLIVRVDAVPEPATLLLVGSGLLGMSIAGLRARRRS